MSSDTAFRVALLTLILGAILPCPVAPTAAQDCAELGSHLPGPFSGGPQ